MGLTTTLTRRWELAHPIFQAPMAGGGDTPELVAAVCEAGAMGFLSAEYRTLAQLGEAACAVRARTARPFGINLFAPQPPAEVPGNVGDGVKRVAPFYAEIGLPPPAPPQPPDNIFAAQLEACLDSGASVFSFTFGLLPDDAVTAIRGRGLFLIGTATTVNEAVALEQMGVDAIVAQGAEAGGHRGSFAASFESGLIGSMALIPQVRDAVQVPVIASGGIMDGRGIAAALVLGASAAQLGTAFLTCDEAGIPEAYKAAILAARESDTRLTRAFSGRPARGIANRFMDEVEPPGAAPANLPFPLQNALTRPLRAAAARQGRAEYLSLWAGQGVRLARRQPAAALVARLAAEAETALRALQANEA